MLNGTFFRFTLGFLAFLALGFAVLIVGNLSRGPGPTAAADPAGSSAKPNDTPVMLDKSAPRYR